MHKPDPASPPAIRWEQMWTTKHPWRSTRVAPSPAASWGSGWGSAQDTWASMPRVPCPTPGRPLSEAEHADALTALHTCTCTLVLEWPSLEHPLGQVGVLAGQAPALDPSTWARLIIRVGMSGAKTSAWKVEITPRGLLSSGLDEASAARLLADTVRA